MSQLQIPPPGDFRIWCARKKEFVAANIAAIILPRSVCLGPQGPNRQKAKSVSDAKNEVKTMVLLVTVHIERGKNIAAIFTAKRVCLSLRYRR